MTQELSWYEKTHFQLCFKGDGEGPNYTSPPCNFENVRVDTSYMNSCCRNDIQVRMQLSPQGREYSWDQQGPSFSPRIIFFPVFLCAGLRFQSIVQWGCLVGTSPSGNHTKVLVCVCKTAHIYASLLFYTNNINTKRLHVRHLALIFNKPSDSYDINKSKWKRPSSPH